MFGSKTALGSGADDIARSSLRRLTALEGIGSCTLCARSQNRSADADALMLDDSRQPARCPTISGRLSMPSRRAVVASGAGLAAAALGYRAWDRGVFTGATGPAYVPWDEWRGSEIDGNLRPLRAAILAASPHDTQPWLFTLSARDVTVYADRARHLGTFDPFRREMHLGLGCAIENFVRSARAFGLAADVQPATGRLELSPTPQPVVAARIALNVA